MFVVKFFTKPTRSLVVGSSIAAGGTVGAAAALYLFRRYKMTRAEREAANRKANVRSTERKETKAQEIKDSNNFDQIMDAKRKAERDEKNRINADAKKNKAEQKKKAKEAWEEKEKAKEEERKKKKEEEELERKKKEEEEEERERKEEEEGERKRKEAEEEAPTATSTGTQAVIPVAMKGEEAPTVSDAVVKEETIS